MMIRTSKEVAVIGLTVALLIAGQFVLSGVKGVEIVTVIFLTFCYCFGAKMGILTATAYSILRCVFFGFFPTVIILYLVYYNLFAIVIGLLRGCLNKTGTVFRLIALSVTAAVLTIFFTLLDTVITPFYFGYTAEATKAYFYASVPVLVSQVVCAIVTVLVMFIPLEKVFRAVKL